MPKKLAYEEVKDFIEVSSNSCCVLQTQKEDYINTLTKINIDCSCGRPFITSFKEFKSQNKRQCNECGNKKNGESKRLTHEEAKRYIEIESGSNYKLLSNYSKSSLPLLIQCDKGHIFDMNLNNFKSGDKRCPYCYGNAKYTYKQVKQIFIKGNCELLSKTYTDNKQLLDYICECGNPSKITLSHFLQGQRCKICESIRRNLTFYENGTAPCSKEQSYINNLLKGKLNYPISNCSLDIAFPDEKIYIEYDGGGHNLSVKLNSITQKEFNKKEMKRNYFLMQKGWKSIRIISLKDKIPSDEKLIEMFNYAKQYLSTGRHYIKFDIDNQNTITSQFTIQYDFGILRAIKTEVA